MIPRRRRRQDLAAMGDGTDVRVALAAFRENGAGRFRLSSFSSSSSSRATSFAMLLLLAWLPCSIDAFQISQRHMQQLTKPTFGSANSASSVSYLKQQQSFATTKLAAQASAASVTASKETVGASNSNNDNNIQQQQQNDDNPNTTTKKCSPSNLHKLLGKHRTQRDVESAIVRLGRQGRTDHALQLYHAVWTLDGLRNQYRIKLQKEKEGESYDKGIFITLELLDNDNGEDGTEGSIATSTTTASQELINLISKSKLRPTTRLMNSAIDACARSYPGQARQSTAFDIFNSATSPLNSDGTKKPGGSLSPNVFTFGSLLACCARNGDVQTSTELLTILEAGTEYPDVALNEVIYSTVISACERASEPNVELALRVLNKGISTLSSSSSGGGGGTNNSNKTKAKGKGTMGVVGYNAAISTMARAAKWKMAVQLLGEMILHSSKNSPVTHHSPSRMNPLFSSLESIREDMAEDNGDEGEGGSGGTAPLLRIGDSEDEDHAVVIIPKPDEVTFGTVLAACERSGKWEELLNVAKAATEYGVMLDGISLTSVLHSCQQLGLADDALQYLELMKHLGNDECENDGVVHVAEQKTNGKRRKGARQPLRGPDGVAYRLAISACARAPGGHRWQDGIGLLNEMRELASTTNSTNCAPPDVMAYTAAIAGCSEAGEYTAAMQLISTMRSEGVQPNVVTLSAVITACASASAKLARRREEEDNVYKAIDMEDVRMPMTRALRLLEAMKSPNSSVKPNIVTYNAAIRACAEGLNLDGSFDLLRQLKEDGLDPTIVTYGSLMTACERVGDVESASKVFRMVKQEELQRKVDGNEDDDEELQVNEIIYGAAISCCRKAREPERALLLLRKMISEKLAPNTATFNTVIAALSDGKFDSKTTMNGLLWEKSLAVYKIMKSKHAPPGVAPNRQTYNIMIRCLSSNLQPGYAQSVINDMRKDGFVPDVDLYTVTVRAYERCGNPIKAIGLMESMREDGYDFYEIKLLDQAFKSGVRILNKVGQGLSASDYNSSDYGQGASSFSTDEDIIQFDDDEYDDYQLIAALK